MKESGQHIARAIVVMGVSGIGKSTLAEALAARLGYMFVEGDAVHPAANIAKMSAGVALTDEDRWPWLDALAVLLADGARAGGVVLSCSALRRCYRDRLAAGTVTVFVHPVLERADLEVRLSAREGHFMPASLLDSQLATLEAPDAREEAVCTVDAAYPTAVQVEHVLAGLAGLAAPADRLH